MNLDFVEDRMLGFVELKLNFGLRETGGEEDVKMEQVTQQSRITAFRSLLS